MKEPKAVTEATATMSDTLKALETEKPMNCCCADDSAEKKAKWNAWGARFNAACEAEGKSALRVVIY